MATVLGRVTVATLVLVGACSRGGFDDRRRGDLSGVDQARGDGPAVERAGDVPRADLASVDRSHDLAPLGAFGAPVKLAALSSSEADDDPSLTEDQLEIYFASHRPGGPASENIYRSTRASLSAPWAPPELVAELNSTSRSCTPRVSLDGLTLYFTSQRTGDLSLHVSTRSSRSDPWSAPKLVPALDSTADEYGGTLTTNGLAIAFYSDRGGDHDLYLSVRASLAAPWGPPVELSELSTADEEGGPQLDPSQRIIYFFSNRPGGKGSRDLWMATRSNTSAPFGAPVPIVELNTPGEESDLWISPDLRAIYFGSTAGGMDLNLHMASR